MEFEPVQITHTEHTKAEKAYETPQIIFEGEITTRAGSPLFGPDGDNAVDPSDLFGNN
jgi:hypothetical protein